MKKPVKAILYLGVALYAVWFFGGIILYPHAPIHRGAAGTTCAPGLYCDKLGGLHSEKEFRNFQIWEDGLFRIFGPVGMICGAFVARARLKAEGKID